MDFEKFFKFIEDCRNNIEIIKDSEYSNSILILSYFLGLIESELTEFEFK